MKLIIELHVNSVLEQQEQFLRILRWWAFPRKNRLNDPTVYP